MIDIQMPSSEVCDRARASRDARFDGLFFIAVRSTGVYCRPVCPAPTVKHKNIIYYPSAAAAAAAGYRPCLRCRPELSPGIRVHGNQDALNRALALIAEGALQNGTMETLASQVGLSTRQLRRLFVANTGATPVAVYTTRRLLLAKQLLTETTMPVTQVALAAGFKSLRRFNSAFHDICGLSPTKIRRKITREPDTNPPFPAGDSMTLRLAYRPPLAFGEMLAFFARRAIPGIERVTSTSYERVMGSPERLVWIRVTAGMERPELLLEISQTDPRQIPEIVHRVRTIFDLDADLSAAHQVLNSDRLLAKCIAQRPGLRVPGGWDGFEILIRAILGQQVSLSAGTTFTRRLVECYGENCENGLPGLNRIFPTPARLMDVPFEQSLGIPKSRAVTLRAAAAAVHAKELTFQAGQNLNSFVERATSLPGIGLWTAHYVAMRALNHPDAFLSGDLVVQKILGNGQRLSERETLIRAEHWRPWRAYAILHLWHRALDQ